MEIFLILTGERIEWNQLLSFLKLAQKASKKPDATIDPNDEDAKAQKSRQTISLFYRFLTSKTGLFLKGPLVHEIAEAIDGMFVFSLIYQHLILFYIY